MKLAILTSRIDNPFTSWLLRVICTWNGSVSRFVISAYRPLEIYRRSTVRRPRPNDTAAPLLLFLISEENFRKDFPYASRRASLLASESLAQRSLRGNLKSDDIYPTIALNVVIQSLTAHQSRSVCKLWHQSETIFWLMSRIYSALSGPFANQYCWILFHFPRFSSVFGNKFMKTDRIFRPSSDRLITAFKLGRTYFVVHVKPFRVMVHFFRQECNSLHKSESLVEILENDLSV